MKHATKTKEVTKDELQKMLAGKKRFTLLNVLAKEGYALGVIKGSMKIPLAELDKRFTELDKGMDVVAYCANTGCDASHKAADLLADKGFTVSVYKGGAAEWAAAGLPVETPAPTMDAKSDPADCCGSKPGAQQ